MMRINSFIIALFFFLLIVKPDYSLAQHQEQPEFRFTESDESKLDELALSQIANKSIPSISIGIVKDGKIVLAKGYGHADVENKIPATKHTIYQIGSVTKMFTGHLLSILIHDGKISLSDTLANFFPSDLSFPKSPSGQEITIKDIATHSSEFPRYPHNLDRIDPDPIKGYSKSQMYIGIELVNIDKPIGQGYNYSNFGYGVLGVAMEHRMEQELSALMRNKIFQAYEMENSSLVFQERLTENLAVPYLDVSPLKRTEPWDMGTLSAAGNIFSSVSDLNRFMIHLMRENPVSSIQMEKLLKINESWSYGLGCFVIDSAKWNTQIIYHGGDIDGYASYLAMYPEHELGIVILTNWGEGQSIVEAFSTIADSIADRFLTSSN